MLETAKTIFQINHNTGNRILEDEFVKAKNICISITQDNLHLKDFFLPSISTNFTKSLLTFDGIKLWNSLPT